MMKNFIKCGMVGWCLEIFWTGLDSLRHKEYKLVGHSSFWMFPIYGLAAFIGPCSKRIQNLNLLSRGFLYMNGIFAVEYVSGRFLSKKNLCPWDYSDAPLNYRSVIRLDYAPLWFFTGLLFEKILKN